MDFKEIQDYCEKHTSLPSPLLEKLDRDTNANILMPRMLSGHLQGRLLAMVSHMLKPKRILEIGTYTGYSCLCLAEGLAEGGHLHTIEINEELEEMISKYISASPYSKNIHLHIGNAMEIVPVLNERFNLVFIDADKENYSNYYDLVFDKINPGGFIIADNVLWSGKVLIQDGEKTDKDTRALIEFNRKVQNDPRVENVLLPVRDGLMVIRKIN